MIIRRSDFTHFFLRREDIVGDRATFPGEESRHIRRVCRVRVGDAIHATDGEGSVFRLEVTEITKTSVSGTIVETRRYEKPSMCCDLAMPLAATQKMDLVIEKCTEIGVQAFHFFVCERATTELIRKDRHDRFHRVAVSAIKQSMRAFLPEFFVYSDLRSLVSRFPTYNLVIFGHLSRDSQPLRAVLGSRTSQKTLVLAGPEAGFSDPEILFLRSASAMPVSFGTRRLRMETAAIVLPALVIEAAGTEFPDA